MIHQTSKSVKDPYWNNLKDKLYEDIGDGLAGLRH